MKTKKQTEIYDIRKKRDIEVIKAFLYKSYGGDVFSIQIFDKITKKVYAGTIHISNWKKEEIK